MKRAAIVVGILLATTVVGCTVIGASREPITILGNADFTEENGVISGEGTAANPYVIAGWEIAVPAGKSYGVKIENVTAPFVLRGVVVNGAQDLDGAAIRVGFSSGGRIEGCMIASSANGIEVVSSGDLVLRDNVLYVSGIGLEVTGETETAYRHDIDRSNLLNDLPIHYYYGLDGEQIEELETNHLTVAVSRGVTVIGNSVLDGDGVRLAFVKDSTVTANVAGRNNNVLTGHAIQLYEAHDNEITANLVKNARLSGIQLTLSSDNVISGNVLGVNDTGVRMIASTGNIVRENELLGCFTAVWLAGGSQDNGIEANTIVGKLSSDGDRRQGIVLDLASSNWVERNAMTDCEIGITLERGASHNRVADNTIVAGGYGFFVAGSNNDIEGNLITQQARGVLFPETYGQSTTRGNRFVGNVLADNRSHVYTNLDAESNVFTGNVFLGDALALVSDRGTGNRWSASGVGNYWGGVEIEDDDRDGFGEPPVIVYPAGAQDTAPLVSIDPAELRLGVLGTLPTVSVSLTRSDGTTVAVEAKLAASGTERWVGFRGFPAALVDGFPGILFSFDEEAERRFTMVTVPFDLDIGFFDADGQLVGSATMPAMSEELFTAASPFQVALELPAGTLEELAIDEGAQVALPVE